MWQNVRNRFDAKGVTNVVWTWIPMGYSGWTCMDKDLYPGNNLVDWIMYDPYGQSDKSTWDSQVGSFYNWMSGNSDTVHAFTSKPWGIAETSTHLSSKAASSAYWVQAKSALDTDKYPKLKAYIVFDSSAGKADNRIMYWCDPTTAGPVVNNASTCGHLEVDNNEQAAYKAFANDPRFTDAFYANSTAPDLVVTSVSASPANPKAGDHVVFSATLKNQGTATTPAGTDIGASWWVDGVKKTSALLPSGMTLGPGASTTITALNDETNSGLNYWVATAGSHTVEAYGDDVDRISESNETNNKLSMSLPVTSPTVDTQPPSVSVAVNTISALVGSTITASATATDDVGVTKVEFYVDNVLKATSSTNPYAATWTAAAVGTSVVTAKAYDAAGHVTTASPVSISITGTPVTTTMGDITGDKKVNSSDYSLMMSHFGTNYPPADIDKDGSVGGSDLAILLAHWTW
jgi:hypothetical protein